MAMVQVMIKAGKRRRSNIAEGETVTYNIRGKLLKYKKVGGVMKYVGVAGVAEKKKKVEKEKPKVAVEKLSKEQKNVLGETGILCKDNETLKYVNQEMNIFKEATTEIDYSKVPGYVRYVWYPDQGSNKYTPNKIGLNLDKILELNKKYDAKMFDGVPKKVMDVIKPYKKIMESHYEEHEAKRKLEKERKKLTRALTESRSITGRIQTDIRKKYRKISDDKYAKDEGVTVISLDQIAEARRRYPIPSILEYGGIDTWGEFQSNVDLLKKDTELTAAERKKLIEGFKKQIPFQKALSDFEKKNKLKLKGIDKIKANVQKELQTDVILASSNAKRADDPSVEKWFKAIYIAYYANRMLLPKVKKNPKLVTAKEAYGIESRKSLQRIFIKKRGEAFTTVRAREKMLSAITEKGQEKMTFSLKTVSSKEKSTIYRKMKETFDSDEHGSFGFKIHNAFKINDTQYYKEYKKIEKQKGNVVISYHGTSFSNAAKIARGGFKVTAPETGRMIGDGIYGSSNSSKSLQYVGEGFSRRWGTRGVLFICKNTLGQRKMLTDSEVSRLACNDLLQYKGYDTTYANKGIGGLRNTEWCCKNPKQFLPIYWIDVELANPGVYE